MSKRINNKYVFKIHTFSHYQYDLVPEDKAIIATEIESGYVFWLPLIKGKLLIDKKRIEDKYPYSIAKKELISMAERWLKLLLFV